MKRMVRVLAIVGTASAVARRRDVRNAARSSLRRAGRRARFLRGRLEGRICRSLADVRTDVDDGVVADRVRSSLGLLEHQLDVPRIHVTVERRVAILHGEVSSKEAALALVQAAQAVPGVSEVRSHLHVGLTPGATPPSAGAEESSPALRSLLDSARRHGGGEETAHAAVGAVLGAFAGMLVPGERAHVASHLPPDVRELFQAMPGVNPGSLRHVDELHVAVASTSVVERERAPILVDAVLRTFRDLVPDEAADVKALLPTEIRAIWDRDTPLFSS